MSKKLLEESVRTSLEGYFRDLRGTEPGGMHDMLVRAVEKPLLEVVMAQADHIVCLNRHVCCEGHAEAVVRDPAFLALFGGRAASELALYAHHHDHAHGPSGEPVHTDG